MALLIGN